ncbi:hypothetical protein SDJN02_04371, partial [Cucurbita argyrosperma subsp. argyrosperma]
MVGERALAVSKKEKEGTVSKKSSEKRGAPEIFTLSFSLRVVAEEYFRASVGKKYGAQKLRSERLSGTIGLLSIALFPCEVTTKFPNAARALSEWPLDEDILKRVCTTPFETRGPTFSSTVEILYRVSRQHLWVSKFEVNSRIPKRNGITLSFACKAIVKWELIRDDSDSSNLAKSCFADSSMAWMLLGSLCKIPASTMRALFLKNGTEKSKSKSESSHMLPLASSSNASTATSGRPTASDVTIETKAGTTRSSTINFFTFTSSLAIFTITLAAISFSSQLPK